MLACLNAVDMMGDGEGEEEGGADVFEHLDFGADAFDFGVVLVFEFGEDGVAVLASVGVRWVC